MALFSSVFRPLFECFTHFLRRRETPLKGQQCAAQKQATLEKLPEAPLTKEGESEAFDFTAKNKKSRRKRRKYGEKEKERKVKRKVKKASEMNEGGSYKDKAEKERETLSLEKIKDRGHVLQKKIESAKFREMRSLDKLIEGGSKHREAGEIIKKQINQKERKTTEPTPLLVEVKPQQILVSPPVRSSFLKPIEGEHPVLLSISEDLPLPAARFKPLPPVTRPPMHPQKPDPAPEEVSLPCSPLQVDPPKRLAAPEEVSLPCSPLQVDQPKPLPAPEEVSLPCSPLQVDSAKPLAAPDEVSLPCSLLQVDPPKPLAVPPCSTPATDELFCLRRIQVSPPKQLVVSPSSSPVSDEVVDLQRSSAPVCSPSLMKAQPSTSSLFEPPPQLMLIDIEDEETEYVEYTGKTIRACDLPKSECPRPLEAEMKPRQMVAWLESDCEVPKEVWSSEEIEVQGYKKDDLKEVGDSKVILGHTDVASQKKKELDEHMMKLFGVASPEGPKNETQHNVNIQEEQTSKRKVALVLFTWVEDKTKKMEEKKMLKEKEQREKRLLLARYRNDPKLKHLFINKHNCNYCSSE
ncbi:phosphatase and actin regulator 4A-like [Carassius auratus]|uniref:Phosphatase and actin regulator 4A-like n=1 Tax=Carassius auratus TaxID=7957 RepID=A0A6P6RL02_CARAU|nr:phosphatase and actin regulator 4A-like [Carassius auratus]